MSTKTYSEHYCDWFCLQDDRKWSPLWADNGRQWIQFHGIPYAACSSIWNLSTMEPWWSLAGRAQILDNGDVQSSPQFHGLCCALLSILFLSLVKPIYFSFLLPLRGWASLSGPARNPTGTFFSPDIHKENLRNGGLFEGRAVSSTATPLTWLQGSDILGVETLSPWAPRVLPEKKVKERKRLLFSLFCSLLRGKRIGKGSRERCKVLELDSANVNTNLTSNSWIRGTRAMAYSAIFQGCLRTSESVRPCSLLLHRALVKAPAFAHAVMRAQTAGLTTTTYFRRRAVAPMCFARSPVEVDWRQRSSTVLQLLNRQSSNQYGRFAYQDASSDESDLEDGPAQSQLVGLFLLYYSYSNFIFWYFPLLVSWVLWSFCSRRSFRFNRIFVEFRYEWVQRKWDFCVLYVKKIPILRNLHL